MKADVERCELAPNLQISRVLTGLWQIADMERDGRTLDVEATAAAMLPYVEAGFTTFDMADHYGSAEEIAGSFRRHHARGYDVQLLTKWVPRPGPVTREGVREAVQRSLDRLQTDSIDLLQFHAWSYADPRYLDCLFYLQELKQQGLIRQLGLTNFDTAHLRLVVLSGIEIVSNQVCFSLIDRRPSGAMSEFCVQHGIKLLAYGTLAGGFLTQRYLDRPEPQAERLSTWSKMKYKRFIDAAGGWDALQAVLRAAESAADRHGVSLANVACRYVLEQPAVGGIIIGARMGQSEHIEENLRLFGFSLDETSRSQIDTALAALSPLPGNSGDEYRRPPYLTASGDLSHHFDSPAPPYTPRRGADGRSRVLSGTRWESIGGYCRALRRAKRIWVSGTTATHGDRVIGGRDAAAQARFVIDKIEGALQSLGGRLEDIVRTRVYVRSLADWESVARVHGERFRHILPTNTLVQASLVGDDHLVEMEAEAVVADTDSKNDPC